MRMWLISLIGITFVGLLLDIFLENNKNNSLIKGIYGLVSIYIIIKPIIIYFSGY